MRTINARRALPVAMLAAGALFLSACGSGSDNDKKGTDDPSSSASPTDAASDPAAGIVDKDGDGCADFKVDGVAKTVKVTGAAGSTVKAEFDLPLKADGLERSVITEGTGAKTTKGQQVKTHVTAFKGSDGSVLGSTDLDVTVGDSSSLGAFAAGADCVPIGSRVVVTVPAKDVYGESGSPDAGITASDTLVVVTDVISKVVPLKPAAWNAPVKVDFSAATPKLTLPPGKPAAKLLLKVLKPGTGKTVAAGDSVTVDYQGTSWDTKKIFDQSYGKQPATFVTTQVVQGFGAALVGQKVGTRLVVTIPPEYAYGKAGSSQSELAGQTLVFVIEIKDTKAG